jgi:hypothetical protein
MTSRALRVFLLVLFVGSIAGAASILWTEEQQGRAAAAAAHGFEARVRTATRALLDVRHAQAGYVAVGQGEDFWIGRVETLLGSSRDALTALQAHARTAEAQDAVDAAAAVFDDFQQMDRRARTYVRNGQRLLASDLVFSDGLDKIDVALGALERAHQAEQAGGDAAVAGHRRAQLLALGGAAGAGLLLMGVLVQLPGQATGRGRSAAPPAATAPAAADSRPIRARPAAAPESPPAPADAPRAAPAAAAQPPEPSVDLRGVAALCTDLARILDVQALPPALERAGHLLHASGIVIWISDPDRRELAPVVAHGYPPQLMVRMGTIACDAENVTAAAFRTGLVQIVKADGDASGAIAAPLVTPSGSVGVMAAELLPGRAADEETRAAAAIVAAQLATLVGPPSARNASETTGAAGRG